VLGDLDLLCLEKECTAHCNPTHEEWEKMARHDPAGTMEMKPPEVIKPVILYISWHALTRNLHQGRTQDFWEGGFH